MRDVRTIVKNRMGLMRDATRVLTPAGTAELVRERLSRSEERRLLAVVRAGRDVCWVDEGDPEPLVTVRIATYNRGPLVAERAIASALRQTYQRIEVLVVGDRCDEATARAVRSVRDPRVRFVNLPARGIYPSHPRSRWMVAGAAPMNAAVTLAQGAWIAPCDDDDELTDDHIEVLLNAAHSQRLEFVFSKAEWEFLPGQWRTVGAPALQKANVVHGAVLYSAGLRFMQYSTTSWKIGEPADWNMWRRMRAAGVRMGFCDQVTYRHYVETLKRKAA